MGFKTQAPLTILYRGDVRDTAILVGLVQSRAPIGIIAYTGAMEREKMDYLRAVNSWLSGKGQPLISIHPYLSFEQLNQVVSDPLPEWGWTESECRSAIRLAGLSLPPEAHAV